MAKSNKQINKEAEVSDNDSSPAVVAYRVGRLEDAVTAGFREHNVKLDRLVENYATKGDVQGISHRVHSLESDRIWIVRMVVGAVVFALLALIGLGFKIYH